jgi:hypothetical protein
VAGREFSSAFLSREVMEKKRRQFKVGERVRVSLPPGRIADATIRAVIPSSEGIKLRVDYGHDETALIHEGDVLSE